LIDEIESFVKEIKVLCSSTFNIDRNLILNGLTNATFKYNILLFERIIGENRGKLHVYQRDRLPRRVHQGILSELVLFLFFIVILNIISKEDYLQKELLGFLCRICQY